MELTLADVAVHKSAYDPDTVLDAWRWRLGGEFAPLLPTVLGHLFLARDDGTVWFLDTWDGKLYQAAGSYDEFRAGVSGDQEFLTRWFLPDVVAQLRGAGVALAPGQCYTPVVSPGVGGSTEPGNFMAAPLRVHLATSGAECRSLHDGRGSVEAKPNPPSEG